MSVALPLDAAAADRLARCLDGGGVALFGADTVYGLACDATSQCAVRRLYELKGRPPTKPSAVMFFNRADALGAVSLSARERAALAALLPGPVTLLLPNRGHLFPLACGPDPDTLGVRVPALTGVRAALTRVRGAILQSSANLSGGPEARRLQDVESALREAVDLAVDAGELEGTASTVIDLRAYDADGTWKVVRLGALTREAIGAALDVTAG